MQIHKKEDDMLTLGSLATRRAAHAELCLQVFEEYQPTGNYSNLNEAVQET